MRYTSSYPWALRTCFWAPPACMILHHKKESWTWNEKSSDLTCFRCVSVTTRIQTYSGKINRASKRIKKKKKKSARENKANVLASVLLWQEFMQTGDVSTVSWRYLEGRSERQIVPSSVPLYVFSPPILNYLSWLHQAAIINSHLGGPALLRALVTMRRLFGFVIPMETTVRPGPATWRHQIYLINCKKRRF